MSITFATISDIQEYEPDVLNYGIPDFTDALTKAQADVERYLRINWWPTQQQSLRFDITRTLTPEMNADLLTAGQMARATVYCALGYYIYPRLSKFEPEMDVFQIKMDYYKKMYAEEMDLVIRDGVEYDANNDDTVAISEKQPSYFMRLKR